MTYDEILSLLNNVRSGVLTAEAAGEKLRGLSFEELGYAKVDHGRAARSGIAEVIYCPGKAAAHISGIVKNMLERGCENVLATRADEAAFAAIAEVDPSAVYHELARIVQINPKPHPPAAGGRYIAIASGGTADIPVAEEAAVTLEVLGDSVKRLYDVGVAGIHRLLAKEEELRGAAAVITVAGMEGALASVVGGLVACPVIAVPTSIGYGANFGGVSALLTMLNSCSSGIGVMNIDNGFGAAVLAHKIIHVKL